MAKVMHRRPGAVPSRGIYSQRGKELLFFAQIIKPCVTMAITNIFFCKLWLSTSKELFSNEIFSGTAGYVCVHGFPKIKIFSQRFYSFHYLSTFHIKYSKRRLYVSFPFDVYSFSHSIRYLIDWITIVEKHKSLKKIFYVSPKLNSLSIVLLEHKFSFC